jgi:hypothetical protein
MNPYEQIIIYMMDSSTEIHRLLRCKLKEKMAVHVQHTNENYKKFRLLLTLKGIYLDHLLKHE